MSGCKYTTILLDMDGTLMDFDACESRALKLSLPPWISLLSGNPQTV